MQQVTRVDTQQAPPLSQQLTERIDGMMRWF